MTVHTTARSRRQGSPPEQGWRQRCTRRTCRYDEKEVEHVAVGDLEVARSHREPGSLLQRRDVTAPRKARALQDGHDVQAMAWMRKGGQEPSRKFLTGSTTKNISCRCNKEYCGGATIMQHAPAASHLKKLDDLAKDEHDSRLRLLKKKVGA